MSVVQQLLIPGEDGAPSNAEFAQFAIQNGLNPEDGSMGTEADVTAILIAAADAAPGQMSAVLEISDGAPTAALLEISTQAGENRALDLRDNLVTDLTPLTDTGVEATADLPEHHRRCHRQLALVFAGAITRHSPSSPPPSSWSINFWFENRRPFLGVITMLPVALVVLWTFGLMYLSGIPFGPVTATLTGLAVGIGVPYTIHMARRFEEDRARFTSINEAIRSTTRHTGGALAGSAFTTAAGFGILITSTLTPFRQMGQVTAYAIGLSLFGAVLVLPSMLVLWERWHRRHGDAGTEKPTESLV